MQHSSNPTRLAATALLGLTSFAVPAAAQWDVNPVPPADIRPEGFHIVVTGVDGIVRSFSAATQRWRPIGPLDPSPSFIDPLQTGDFVALVRTTRQTYEAYSARLDASASIDFVNDPDQMFVCVDDDVILMIGFRPGAATEEAWAYSGQTNKWVSVPTPEGIESADCSRFVAGVVGRDSRGHGFSARTGMWHSTSCPSGGTVRADGNTVLLDYPAPLPTFGFSGVIGVWDLSPPQNGSAGPLLDHNVALARVDIAPAVIDRACAFSAYTGKWDTAPAPGRGARVSDNTASVTGRSPAGTLVQAFAAQPGTWNPITVPGPAPRTIGEDWLTVSDGPVTLAFSGLTGAWVPQPMASAPVISPIPRSLAVGQDAAGEIYAFSATLALWSPPLPAPGATITARDSHVLVDVGPQYAALGARNAVWVAGPAKVAGGIYVTASGESISTVHERNSGMATIFHERQNSWLPLPPVPPVFTPVGGGNQIWYDDPGAPPFGISAQRGDGTGAIAPTVTPPVLEENVGYALDPGGFVVAFGTPADTHTWFQYPLGTEYQVFSGGPLLPSRTMIRGRPGDAALLLVGVLPAIPPIPTPIGTLGLFPAAILVTLPAPAPIGPNGLLPIPVEIPIPGPPTVFEAWTQGLLIGGGGPRLAGAIGEPIRFY